MTNIHNKHIAQQSYIHYAQMMITTTAIHTQCTNNDYRFSASEGSEGGVKYVQLLGLLKVIRAAVFLTF